MNVFGRVCSGLVMVASGPAMAGRPSRQVVVRFEPARMSRRQPESVAGRFGEVIEFCPRLVASRPANALERPVAGHRLLMLSALSAMCAAVVSLIFAWIDALSWINHVFVRVATAG